MLSRPWCPDPCVTSDPQHMVGQRSFDKLAASRCRRVTPLSWKSLWRAASSKRRVTPWRHAPGRRIRAVVARLLHWSSRVPCPRSVDSDSSYQSTCRQAFLQMSPSEDERDAALSFEVQGTSYDVLATTKRMACRERFRNVNEIQNVGPLEDACLHTFRLANHQFSYPITEEYSSQICWCREEI